MLYTLLYQPNVRALVLIGSSGPKHQTAKPPENIGLSSMERFMVETVWLTPFDVVDELKNIHVPTLILAGGKDPRLEVARLMHSNIPASTLKVIEGYGHEMTVDSVKLCVDEIPYWLEKI